MVPYWSNVSTLISRLRMSRLSMRYPPPAGQLPRSSAVRLERDDFSSNRYPAPAVWWSMIPRVEPEGRLFPQTGAQPGSRPGPGFFAITLAVAHLVVARLARRDRREQRAVGLEIDERRAVEAVEPAHQEAVGFHFHQAGDAAADRVGTHRRAQAEGAARRPVVRRALPHQVAPRQVHPIEDLDALIVVDAVESRDPRREDLDAAGRPVGAPLARAHQTVGPRRVDASDEDEAGIGSGRRIDRNLARPDLVAPDHRQSPRSPTRRFVPRRLVRPTLRCISCDTPRCLGGAGPSPAKRFGRLPNPNRRRST